MVDEIAKAKNDALKEVDRTLDYIKETIKQALEIQPEVIQPSSNKKGIFSRVAKGVGLAISPFNYPLNLSMSKIAPALIMGNTLVFKPATAGSLTGSFLGQLAVEANLPPGVFNVVTGKGSQIGDMITQNKEINFLSFTGSVPVGHHILEIASTKDAVLELGGKDPAIILDDHNLNFVADEIMSGAYSYSGQRCTAIKRVITTNAIADKLVPLLKAKIEKLVVGLPSDNADIVPLIDLKAADYVQGLIDDTLKNHQGKLIIGNQREKNLL
jgi:glyceraldehyde-3-phosphate dehydrogenase (NADP+)